jgi:hypothetical protein
LKLADERVPFFSGTIDEAHGDPIRRFAPPFFKLVALRNSRKSAGLQGDI